MERRGGGAKTSAARPSRIREELFLASVRQTTRQEDNTYCLFGSFDFAIPVIYGEGDHAVGRLLEHISTNSRDITILAWTGHAGSYSSCLPPDDLKVYNTLVPPHVPQLIKAAEMDGIIAALRSSLPDLSMTVTLLAISPAPPSFISRRLTLPSVVFPITALNDPLRPGSGDRLARLLRTSALDGRDQD